MLVQSKEMYENGTKSEASLARAVHILTLGAFAWDDDTSSLGGVDAGVSNSKLRYSFRFPLSTP